MSEAGGETGRAGAMVPISAYSRVWTQAAQQPLPLLLQSNRKSADGDAGGGTPLQTRNPMAAKARSLIPCELGRDFKSLGIASSIEELTTV